MALSDMGRKATIRHHHKQYWELLGCVSNFLCLSPGRSVSSVILLLLQKQLVMITGLNQPVPETVPMLLFHYYFFKKTNNTDEAVTFTLVTPRGRARRLERSFNPPLIHEKSWSSWGLRRQKGGWWAAWGNQGWAWTWLRPLPAPLISEKKPLKWSGQTKQLLFFSPVAGK